MLVGPHILPEGRREDFTTGGGGNGTYRGSAARLVESATNISLTLLETIYRFEYVSLFHMLLRPRSVLLTG